MLLLAVSPANAAETASAKTRKKVLATTTIPIVLEKRRRSITRYKAGSSGRW
jgi:hypothetical protein